MAWTPEGGEIPVFYDVTQRVLYEAGLPSEYDPWSWPLDLRVGRNERGCFPEVAVRAFFERQGYKVLLSAPKYPDGLGFILFHYRGMRKADHPAFKRMQEHFPAIDLNKVADRAQRAKAKVHLSGGVVIRTYSSSNDAPAFSSRSRKKIDFTPTSLCASP